jgi:hypothetical protein
MRATKKRKETNSRQREKRTVRRIKMMTRMIMNTMKSHKRS